MGKYATQLTEQLNRLGELVNHEVDEWEQIDKNSLKMSLGPSFSIIPPFLPIFFGGHTTVPGQPVEQLNSRWEKMDEQERIGYLQEQYNRLAKKYGLEPITLVTEDLEDKKLLGLTISDAKGVFRSDKKELVIDIDNLNSDKGVDVLQTLIHETRHQVQFQMIELYHTNGENAAFPEGITLEQVKAWDQNLKDGYIAPDDNYEGYRKQAIEVDSRNFAKDNANELAQEEYLPAGTVRA